MEPFRPEKNTAKTRASGTIRPGEAQAAPRIPDHELVRQIAAGSYGEVWLARNVLGTFRAVKVVHRRSFDRDRPYEREYEGIQKFEPVSRTHEGFVDVLQVGRNDAEEYFYYVMELGDDCARGQSIEPDTYRAKTLATEVGNRGRLPIEECVHLAIKLTDALHHLHDKGLTHRDIKPSNIVFVDGAPKLADVGLVADIGEGRSYVGTEGYIAPEGPGAPQADIFSLGKVLYEIGTGKDRHDFPELPDAFDTFVDAEAFREFNEILLRACHADPRQRYPSARKMQAELTVLLNGASIRRLRLLERRLRTLKRVGVGALAACVLVTLIGYPFFREVQVAREKRERQIGASIAEGAAFLQSGRVPDALAKFTKALALSDGKREREEINRLRCATTLALCPKLTQMGFIRHMARTIRFSADGQRLLVCSSDGGGRILDVRSGEWATLTFARAERPYHAVFSPDATQVATANQSKDARVWDARTGALLAILPHPNSKCLLCVAYSPDGSLLATGPQDDHARIWDARGSLVRQLDDPHGGVTSVCFSPDNRLLATAGWDRTLCLWDVATGERLARLAGHIDWVNSVAFSPDGKRLVSAGGDRTVRVWDIATSREIPPAMLHDDGVREALFSPDGQLIASASGDWTLRFWDAPTHRPTAGASLLRNSARATCLDFDPRGHRVAVGANDGTLRVWDFAGVTLQPRAPDQLESADDSRVVRVLADALEVSGRAHPATNHTLTHRPFSSPIGVQLLADGRWLACQWKSDSSLSCIEVVEVQSGKPLAPEIAPPSAVDRWQVSPDLRVLFTSYRTNGQLWDLGSGKPLGPVVEFPDGIDAFAFSPNSGQVLLASAKRVHLLDAATGCAQGPALSFPYPVGNVKFSPDGEHFVSCLKDGTWNEIWAQVWTTKTRRPLSPFLRHGDGVLCAAFGPDGKRLATGGEDYSARLWDAATGKMLTPPMFHSGQVSDVAFSRDGRWLLTVGSDQTARLWDVETGEPISPALVNPDILNFGWFLDDPYHLRVGYRSTENWRWDLVRDTRPVADWLDLAFLLSPSMSLTWQDAAPSPAESAARLAVVWRRMRAAHPEDFSTTESDVLDWRIRQAAAAERAKRWAVACLHLDRLVASDPTNSVLALRREEARRKRAETGE